MVEEEESVWFVTRLLLPPWSLFAVVVDAYVEMMKWALVI